MCEPMIEFSPERRTIARRTAYVAVPALVATLAVLHPGAAVSQVDLNDGTVWLTATNVQKVGRYNPTIEEINAGLVLKTSDFDVLQDGMDVLIVEPNRVAVVDPALVSLGAMVDVPYDSDVSMAGGTTSITRPTDGAVYAAPTQGIGAIDMADGDPAVALGEGGRAVVTRSGEVLAVEPGGAVHRLEVGAEEVAVTSAGTLDGTLLGQIEQITAVGDDVAVIAAGHLHTTGTDVDLSAYGSRFALQQAGPDADSVLVATETTLLEIPIDGGSPREITGGGGGAPAAPVRVAGCVHAAWASPATPYLMSCGSQTQVVELTSIASSDQLVFRVNRDVVVLNDAVNGRVWLPMEDPEVREPNWVDVEEEPDTVKDQTEETNVVTANLQSVCEAQQAPPSAADDEYGVRPGSTTLLTVIDNDAASNCGILVISDLEPIEETIGTLEIVHGGRALQLTTQPGAQGTAEFRYSVRDGRADTNPATATVRVSIQPDGVNEAPVQLRVGAMTAEQGGGATYDVLADFRDPEGDPLVLTAVVAQSGGTARARGDGRIRFQSDGTSIGRHRLVLTVSDGTHEVEGEMYVDVGPAGSVPPVVDPVQTQAFVDQPVTIEPLKAVRTESRQPARLAAVEEVTGLIIEPDIAGGTFTVTARAAGIYYVPFTITAAPQQATGLARIDVVERPEGGGRPVPVVDVALLPPGVDVTIDPLANDSDPSGSVLMVQNVTADPESALRVAVLDHRLVQVSTMRTLERAEVLTYEVSNGGNVAQGRIIVQPVPVTGAQQPPVVEDVEVSVRAGGVVTIPVMEGAFDPDGDPLELQRELAEEPAAGLMFVSGDVLRYQAPTTPGTVRASFTVTDPMLNETAGTVEITIHEADPAKAPPRPVPLESRVYAGESVRIRVPLVGIDVDGDGVLLLGQDRAPTKGIVRVISADELEYEAFPGESGTDVFSYAVEDWAGQRAVATVRVGVSERPRTAAAVVTNDDAVTVRPGQKVEVRVLANDVDTGGGELELDAALEEVPAGIQATTEGRRIVVTTADAGIFPVVYTARNERGGVGQGVLTVTVDPDAPILPPIARDVVVPPKDTIDQFSVDVDVLGVAQNPSGSVADLRVEVDASVTTALVTPDQKVRVTLTETPQTLPYVLRNTDPEAEGIASYAFITVPALGDFPPLGRRNAPALQVIAGEPLEIRLAEQVQVAPGKTPIVDDPSTVQATKSDGSTLVVDEETLTYTSLPDYAGPASISAVVSDGPLGDPGTHSSSMTFPITVLAAEQHPPVFTPSVLEVPAGDTTQVDLDVFTSAPVATVDGTADYSYSTSGTLPAGLTATLNGSVLSVSADPTTARGTVAGIPLTIDYGGSEGLAAQVDVRVVASARPLPRALTHQVPNGVEGQPSTVSVLDGAYNPYPEEGPLRVLDAVVETTGSGTADVVGDQVVVRPNDGFIGQMVTRYTVGDATRDPARVAEGRIVVTVRGAPERPTRPVLNGTPGNAQVHLEWVAPANNGEPIDSYRVVSRDGSVEQTCASTQCTITGLRNGTTYQFTVAAHNAVGWSEPSDLSAEMIPDTLPPAPQNVRIAPGGDNHRDGHLDVQWDMPPNEGSAITDVFITVAGRDRIKVPAGAREWTIGGLTNGTSYTITVSAANRLGEGPASAALVETPAGTPGKPEVTGWREGGTLWGGTSSVILQWPTVSANGRPYIWYEVRMAGGGWIRVDGTEYRFPDVPRESVTFEVRALTGTEAPWIGAPGSKTVDARTAPAAVTDLTAAEAGPGEAQLAWTPPGGDGGTPVTSYRVTLDGGSTSRTLNGNRVTTGAGDHEIQIAACNSIGCGEWSNVAPVTVTALPGSVTGLQVTASPAEDNQTVVASWTGVSSTGAMAITYWYQYRFSNGGTWSEWSEWTSAGESLTTPAITIPENARRNGGSVEFQVHAVNGRGEGPDASASAWFTVAQGGGLSGTRSADDPQPYRTSSTSRRPL